MPEKVSLTQAEIEELARCILRCEWNSADELEKYINDFLSDVEEEVKTPEPDTSVIRWTRYDGTSKTLPRLQRRIMLCRNGFDNAKISHLRIDGDWQSAMYMGCDKQIGDLWTYLPEPPEEMA